MIGVALAAPGPALAKQQWDFALCNFKPDQVFVYGDCSTLDGYLKKVALPIKGVGNLPRETTLVLMSPTTSPIPGEISLEEFTHPKDDVVYWFGSDSRHTTPEDFSERWPEHIVHIGTDTKDQMYSHATWLVTAWDRRVRCGHPR